VLTVRLAHLFGQAVGLDPDAEMLAEGGRAARDNQVRNIRWVQALAEDLPAAAPGPYRLVTFGSTPGGHSDSGQQSRGRWWGHTAPHQYSRTPRPPRDPKALV
jgi:hypothetical protein